MFKGMCKMNRSQDPAVVWASAEAHGFARGDNPTMTFDDGDAFAAHVKTCGRARPVPTNYRRPRMWRPALTVKPFDPAVGEVGSWVTFGDVTGQVWAPYVGGKHPRVWVADGATYHDVAVRHLRPVAAPAAQLEMVA